MGGCVLIAGTTSAATRPVPSTFSVEPSIAAFSHTSLVPPPICHWAGWAPGSPPFHSPTLTFFWLDEGPVEHSLRPTHWLFPPVLLSSHSFWPLAIGAERSGPTFVKSTMRCVRFGWWVWIEPTNGRLKYHHNSITTLRKDHGTVFVAR